MRTHASVARASPPSCQYSEFVAAEPRDNASVSDVPAVVADERIIVLQTASKPLSRFDKQRVPDQMTETVLARLETINIKEE